MKLLYIGTGDLQQTIAEVLNLTRGNHEVLVAVTREAYMTTLEQGTIDLLLFDCGCPTSLSLEQVNLYARAFKTPVVALASIMGGSSAVEIRNAGISGYVFREHLDQLPFVIDTMVKKVQLRKEKEFLQQTLELKKRFYQTLLKNMGDFVFLFDERGDLVYLSPSANQLTGFSDLEGKQLFEYIHPDDRKTFFHLFKRVLKKPDARVDAHFRILHKSGHYIWIEGGITNLVKDESIEAFVLSCRDVTERRETEQAMVRLNRLYASIGQINRAILSIEDEQALFKEVCCIATEFGNFRMAYISLIDPATGRLKLMQSSGVAEEDVEPSMVVQDLEYAPFTSVLQTGQCYVCNDVQNDLDEEFWKYVARHKNFGSFVILPLSKSGRTAGVFVLAASGTDSFFPKEIELLEETVDDLSFKLDTLKKEKARMVQIVTRVTDDQLVQAAVAR